MKMLKKIINYCGVKGLEVKKNQGGGINIYVPWRNRQFEKYLKNFKVKYSVTADSNFDYRIYSIQ